MLAIDRSFDGVFFDAGEGGEPMLFVAPQLALLHRASTRSCSWRRSAVISEIIPTLSRKPLFSHSAVTRSLVADRRPRNARLDAEPLREPASRGLRLLRDARRGPAPRPDRPDLRRLDPHDVGRRRLDARAADPRDHRRAIALVLGLAGQLATSVVGVGPPAREHGRRPAGHDPGRHRVRPCHVRGAPLLAAQGHRPRRPRGAREGRSRAHPRRARPSTASRCSSRGSPASRSTSSATSKTMASRRST